MMRYIPTHTGVSLWQGVPIQFDLRGLFDLTARRVKLVKQHKGRYTNRVVYEGVFYFNGGFMTPRASAELAAQRPEDSKSVCFVGTYPRGHVILRKSDDEVGTALHPEIIHSLRPPPHPLCLRSCVPLFTCSGSIPYVINATFLV